MKFIIISLFILLLSQNTFAFGLKEVIILSAIESNAPVKPIKNKEQLIIEVIEATLPNLKYYASKDEYRYSIPQENSDFYLSYFKNQGYKNVILSNNELIFKFPGHAKKRIELDIKYKRRGYMVMFALIPIVMLFIYHAFLRKR